MDIALPWAVLMVAQAYEHGIHEQKLPEPYYFFWGTAGMASAGLLGMWNPRLGALLAWGLLIGAFVYNYQTGKKAKEQASANANPSVKAVTTAGTGPVVPPQQGKK